MPKRKEPRAKKTFNTSIMVNGSLIPEVFPDVELQTAISDMNHAAAIVARKTGADYIGVTAMRKDERLLSFFGEY